jgi:hypothetical protein
MATTQYSLRVQKKFTFRGSDKFFSNRYYFDGGAPADSTAWHNLMDAVVALEKTIYVSVVQITDCFGYGPSSEVAVASKAYTQNGTATPGAGIACPGECVALLRMATTKMSVKNHPVYCFSYFHGVLNNNASTTVDEVFSNQQTWITNYGDAWLNGITVGARTYKRTTPDGHPTTGKLAEKWITHRDFPR